MIIQKKFFFFKIQLLMNKRDVVSRIENHKVVAIVRLPDPDLTEPVVAAMYKGGIRVLEITMTVPGALSLIRKAAGDSPPDLLIGVGSVLDAETVNKAVEAGARFIVSPVTK
ncbi:MAG: bifunctional 4-hydroxy-2-oxoglutarate aldolase/2-dehydro-3-deoxy-phosphogluconate aldolase, partial [Balneolaceae bacterium]